MSGLSQYSIDELERELKRKKALSKGPMPLSEPFWGGVQRAVEAMVEEMLERGGYHDDENAHWIFEAACEALYGTDFWNWYNNTSTDVPT